MVSSQMIYGGFDPSFIDINIQPFDDTGENLIKKLPSVGSHHTSTNIHFIPGGNGFNLCRTLGHLGHTVAFVGPSSQLYEYLVKVNNYPLKIIPIQNADVNFTGVLNLFEGEIQFNSVKGQLSPENLSPEIIEYYNVSPLKSISNIALNPTSIEWICSLVLSLWSSDDVLDLLHKSNPLQLLNKQPEIDFSGVMFIDPSDISNFSRIKEFQLFLKELKKLHGEKYLSVNEHELKALTHIFHKTPKELFSTIEFPVIFHSASEVIFYGKEVVKFPTKKLETKKTFVGAGDCFNGSFIHSVFENKSIEDSLTFAIEAASFLIETGKYLS